MKNNSFKEIFTGLALVVVSILLLDPFDFLMPSMMFMAALVVLLVAFAFFASFVLKERPMDEREEVHQAFAGRIGFVVGVGVLIVGIFFQGLAHKLDPWLVLALSAMVITKMVARFYRDNNN